MDTNSNRIQNVAETKGLGAGFLSFLQAHGWAAGLHYSGAQASGLTGPPEHLDGEYLKTKSPLLSFYTPGISLHGLGGVRIIL